MIQSSPFIPTPLGLALTTDAILPGVTFVQTPWLGRSHLSPQVDLRLHLQESLLRDLQAAP